MKTRTAIVIIMTLISLGGGMGKEAAYAASAAAIFQAKARTLYLQKQALEYVTTAERLLARFDHTGYGFEETQTLVEQARELMDEAQPREGNYVKAINLALEAMRTIELTAKAKESEEAEEKNAAENIALNLELDETKALLTKERYIFEGIFLGSAFLIGLAWSLQGYISRKRRTSDWIARHRSKATNLRTQA